MSLVVVTYYKDGIILACDSFVFDNDDLLPTKKEDFNKLFISKKLGMVALGVGSSWVFDQFTKELTNSKIAVRNDFHILSRRWKEIAEYWKENRENELGEEGNKILRPLSDSNIIFATTNNPHKITIIDQRGEMHQTEKFVAMGSGSYLVEEYILSTKKIFIKEETLLYNFQLLQEIYQFASQDLYVNGIPSVTMIRNGEIIDFSDSCKELWQRNRDIYKKQLLNKICGEKRIGNEITGTNS